MTRAIYYSYFWMAVAIVLAVITAPTPAYPSNCATVRYYVGLYGYATAARWARSNLSRSQLRRARACLRGR